MVPQTRVSGRVALPQEDGMRKRTLLGLAVAAALLLSGCGGSGNDAASSGSSTAASSGSGKLSGTLTVFAAASLTDVFTHLGKQLEQQNPGLKVTFNFAGSDALAAQITQGAPADVFASANTTQMKVVTDAGLQAAEPRNFAENVLEIAVPQGNPGHVTGIKDFENEALTLAVCAPTVPCGAAAQKVFQAAGVNAKPDTQEEDVKAALTKVQLGEVDAALVYRTDVKAAGSSVGGIDFPEADDAVNQYPIVALKAAPNPEAAKAFVDLVNSDPGQRALKDAGFRGPTG
jgi:molybdate transport system substrate-binding protein